MKLIELNDDQIIEPPDKYSIAKRKGNISRKQANNNPDKTEPNDSIPNQVTRSGNQQAISSNDDKINKFIGNKNE